MRNEIVFPTVPHCELKLCVGTSTSKRHDFCSMHYHSEIELLQIKQGRMNCILQNRVLEAYAGDVIFINERIPHSTEYFPGLINSMIQFRADNISPEYGLRNNYNMMLFLRDTTNDCVILKSGTKICEDVNDFFNKMTAENEKQLPAYETYLKGYLTLLAGTLSRNGLIQSYNYNSDLLTRISPIVQYVDNNFKKDISLDEICNRFSVNKSYFCRQFKRATNRTFIEYLNFVRVLEAERLLHSMDESIMDISLECGFSGVSYFNRVFKAIIGYTPSEYRKIKSSEEHHF